MCVSLSPGIVSPLTATPQMIAPTRAPTNAPTIPPEAVGQEDREVPDGEPHHHPCEHGHG
jgi:hypothetical protein